MSVIRQIDRTGGGTIPGMSDANDAFLDALDAGGPAPDRGGTMV